MSYYRRDQAVPVLSPTRPWPIFHICFSLILVFSQYCQTKALITSQDHSDTPDNFFYWCLNHVDHGYELQFDTKIRSTIPSNILNPVHLKLVIVRTCRTNSNSMYWTECLRKTELFNRKLVSKMLFIILSMLIITLKGEATDIQTNNQTEPYQKYPFLVWDSKYQGSWHLHGLWKSYPNKIQICVTDLISRRGRRRRGTGGQIVFHNDKSPHLLQSEISITYCNL